MKPERDSRPVATNYGAADVRDGDLDDISIRRGWAYALIRRAAYPSPPYGSSAWLALPEGDSAKVAAVVVAAEAWAQDGDTLPERLADEVSRAREAFKAEEDAEYVARAQAHREGAPRLRARSFAERRAEQIAAAAPRLGDYPGGAA